MYKCLKSDFGKLEKKINNIIKKLDKYNLEYNFEILGQSIESVNIVECSMPNHPVILDTIFTEVISYNFTMEKITLGNYNVIAILKHNQITGSKENLVYPVDENTINKKYRTLPSNCDHCNTKRKRNNTVILETLDNPGELLQIGLTCLKEYTGITDIDVIKNFMHLQDIFTQDLYIKCGFDDSHYQPLVKTINYLANSVYLIKKEGYIKEVTKGKAWDYTLRGLEINNEELKEAEKIISFFEKRDFHDNEFMQNIKLLLQNEYSKVSGFIAYAYLAYQKQKEYEKNKQIEDDINKLSNYVGSIGERLNIEVSLVNRYAFDTFYDYQQLYIFKDDFNNIYKWKTSVYLVDHEGKSIELNENKFKIKGTVKGHEIYKGAKQTELTRCKITI